LILRHGREFSRDINDAGPLGGDAAMGLENKRRPVQNAAGFSVHVLTASGGAVALLALYAAIERDFATTFAWLGVAMFIDGIDGTLARAARVTETAATIDGVVLDLVIDFLTYVIAPVVALWRSDLMPTLVSFWIGLIVTIASALYFADTRMKTTDNWFRGFPALWNVFIFYLFVFRLPWVINAAAMLIAAALMFAPVVFVHPLRVEKLRLLTIAATIAWFVFAAIAIFERLDADLWAKAGLIATAAYFLVLPLLRHSPWAQDEGRV
jgi:phosphatidylcholine synthase